MNSIKSLFTILHKDILIEFRNKEILLSMLVFAFIIIFIFNFIFVPGSNAIKETTPGILWVAIIFANNLGLSRSFAREYETGRMQGLLMCPVDRGVIYLAKVIGNFIFISLIEILTVPLMIILYDFSFQQNLGILALILILGNIGLTSLGTLFSTISAQTKSREVMLPILLFPVSIPIILAATKATTSLYTESTLTQTWSWIRMLAGFDIVYLVTSFLLFEFILEE